MTVVEEALPEPQPLRRPRRVRRIGCGIALALWFTLLLTPCLCIVLAVQQEILVPLGSAPGQELRIWLINQARERGLGISTGQVTEGDDTALCVQTTTRFLLWAGQGDTNAYCECYIRENASEPWSSSSVEMNACG